MIEIEQLSKNFGSIVAVRELTLRVPPGQLFALLGPNGAGKTTTLKLLAGLLRPSAGRVRVGGFDVQTQPLQARRALAYVPDTPFLYEKLTPWEFFCFMGRLFEMAEARWRRQAQELVERFHLQEWTARPIESLSLGTRQRVAIVSAFLHEPSVFVIDEPLVGLDPQHARVVKDLLKERCRAGLTVLLSTHQLGIAEEMADRVGIMHRGRLVAQGSAQELTRNQAASAGLEEVFLALVAAQTGPDTGVLRPGRGST